MRITMRCFLFMVTPLKNIILAMVIKSIRINRLDKHIKRIHIDTRREKHEKEKAQYDYDRCSFAGGIRRPGPEDREG